MNLEKVVFGFFVVLALTLNLGFVMGEIENPAHHNVIEFFLVQPRVVQRQVVLAQHLGQQIQTVRLGKDPPRGPPL